MGRAAFTSFLTDHLEPSQSFANTGIQQGPEFLTWTEILAAAKVRAKSVEAKSCYLVSPTKGIDSVISLLAVATVPDTMLIWHDPAEYQLENKPITDTLSRISYPLTQELARPLWGVATSGSSGTPKIAIGYADSWEIIVLHYTAAIFRPAFGGNIPERFATCLPLKFSAAFFMTLLPALFLQRDLVLFDHHDWTAVSSADQNTCILAVPAIAAAACLGMSSALPFQKSVLFLGAGHISVERLALIRRQLQGVDIRNLYGTAETGALSIDPSPGHNLHVGRPIAGKSIWINEPDSSGIGAITAAGPDCCHYIWQPGHPPQPSGAQVSGTDYGSFNAEGQLSLAGRVDGGEKLGGILVYPKIIERHLMLLPGVSDAKVYVKRMTSGLEHLAAKTIGTATEDMVRNHCLDLPVSSRPSRFECIAEKDAATAYSSHGKM